MENGKTITISKFSANVRRCGLHCSSINQCEYNQISIRFRASAKCKKGNNPGETSTSIKEVYEEELCLDDSEQYKQKNKFLLKNL